MESSLVRDISVDHALSEGLISSETHFEVRSTGEVIIESQENELTETFAEYVEVERECNSAEEIIEEEFTNDELSPPAIPASSSCSSTSLKWARDSYPTSTNLRRRPLSTQTTDISSTGSDPEARWKKLGGLTSEASYRRAKRARRA